MVSRYFKNAAHVMLGNFTQGAAHIYIACGPTDFRKQIDGLAALVSMKFQLDPYSSTSVFIFCNRRRNALKVLRFEESGFVLASKKLIKGMHFQWPKDQDGLKDITPKQMRWLLEGLEIEPKKAHRPITISRENTCF